MKSKIYKIGIPAGVAVLAIAVVASFGSPPMAQAHPGFFGHHSTGHGFYEKVVSNIPEIEGTILVGESIKESIESVKIDALEAGAIAAESIKEGKVLRGGIVPTQGYLVYHYAVVSPTDDQLYRVIVDAGNGKILHTSEGISLADLDAIVADMKSIWQKMSRL